MVVTTRKCQYCITWTLTKSILCGNISLKVSVLFDVNSDKKSVVLFCINSVKVSEFHIWSLKLSSYCFLSFAYLWTCLKQSSFIVIRKKIIRWGSHFCMSLFPSIPPSVTHYIFSGIVHHLIIIFGTHMQNNDIVRCFFHFFKILIFWAVRGQQWTTISPTKGQQIAQKEK